MPRIAHVVLDTQAGYACALRARGHALAADEARSHGGTDTGPTPYELLLSSLAACTAITLRMVGERKGWALGAIHVDVELHKDETGADRIAPHGLDRRGARPGTAGGARREDTGDEDRQGRREDRDAVPSGLRRLPARVGGPASK